MSFTAKESAWIKEFQKICKKKPSSLEVIINQGGLIDVCADGSMWKCFSATGCCDTVTDFSPETVSFSINQFRPNSESQ